MKLVSALSFNQLKVIGTGILTSISYLNNHQNATSISSTQMLLLYSNNSTNSFLRLWTRVYADLWKDCKRTIWEPAEKAEADQHFQTASWADFNTAGWSWKIKDENIPCSYSDVEHQQEQKANYLPQNSVTWRKATSLSLVSGNLSRSPLSCMFLNNKVSLG